jgi:hypothetical protein
VGDVIPDGLEGKPELVRDRGVAFARGDQLEHLALACGQRREDRLGDGASGEMFHYLSGDGGSEYRFTGSDRADSAQDLVLVSAFEQVPACSGPTAPAGIPALAGPCR